jgi:hypothetical protein
VKRIVVWTNILAITVPCLTESLIDLSRPYLFTHTGFVYSDIWRNYPAWQRTLFSLAALSCEQAAQVVVFAATQPEQEVDGQYVSPYWFPSAMPNYLSSYFDYLGPFAGARVMPSADYGSDMLIAQRLWEYSVESLSAQPNAQ